jgi:hypothetical protein
LDQRENILARLVVVCAAVEGVANAVRNRLDVTQLERPAIVVLDGSEHFRDAPQNTRGEDRSDIQRMDLMPAISIHVRGSDSVEGGGVLSLYRSRVVSALLNDATLLGYLGTNGRVRYGGCTVAAPTAEGREYRIDLSLLISYVFRLQDIAAVGRANNGPGRDDRIERPGIDRVPGQAAGNAAAGVAA